MADSWTISRDGLQYVFHIREGVRFHSGREVTAEDFAYSLTRVFTEPFLSEGLAAGYLDAIDGVHEFIAGKATEIRGIRVLDDRQIQITLSHPYRPLLTALALDQTSAVPRELVEKGGKDVFEREPVGCGPFRYVRRDAAQGIVLAANPDYFMGKPAIDTLIFYAPHGDVTSQGADALLDGRATLSTLPVNRIEEFRARPGITMLRWQDLTLAFLGMNATLPPLDDARVREAVAMAIDRQAMLDLQPEGKALASGILPPGLPGYTPVQKTYPHDLARARELLAEAGYGPDRPLPPAPDLQVDHDQCGDAPDRLAHGAVAGGGRDHRGAQVCYVGRSGQPDHRETGADVQSLVGGRYSRSGHVPPRSLLLHQLDQLLPLLQRDGGLAPGRRARHR